MLPTPGFVDGSAPPHTGSSVEIEKDAATRPPRMLKHEVPVEQNGLDLGQQRVVTVDVCPAGLHHPHFRVGEVVNALEQKVGWRNKISVENGDELALGGLQAGFERSRLEAVAILSMNISDGIA